MTGYRVRYVLAAKLVNELVEAADDTQLTKTIARYGRVDLLCIDELGYMELDRRGAELLFQVLTEREENNSVAIASNESFGGWTKTFTDPAALRGDRRPPHLRWQHPRNRHRLLPARTNPRQSRPCYQLTTTPGLPAAERRAAVLTTQGRPRTRESGVSSQQQKTPQDQQLDPQLADNWIQNSPTKPILPWFIAGALFPITALPAWLAWVARALPTTHVLALLRYGVLDRTGAGLHDIWGMTSTTTDAALSLLVLAGWAILITAAAIRVFTRSAVN